MFIRRFFFFFYIYYGKSLEGLSWYITNAFWDVLLPPGASLREFTRTLPVLISQLDVQGYYLWGTLMQEPELWVSVLEMCSLWDWGRTCLPSLLVLLKLWVLIFFKTKSEFHGTRLIYQQSLYCRTWIHKIYMLTYNYSDNNLLAFFFWSSEHKMKLSYG